MSRLVANIRLAISALGTSENALAETAGVQQSTMNRITNGESKDPRDSTIEPLATYLGLTVDELKRGAAELVSARLLAKFGPAQKSRPIYAYDVRPVEGSDGLDPDHDVMIPEVEVELSGGPGTFVPEYVETKFRVPYQLYWFKAKGAKPENVKLMRVNGHSMEPVLFDGDRVAVDTANKRIVEGRVYAIYVGNEARVKRLFNRPDGALRIVSYNDDKATYPDEIVPATERDSVYIIGRVIDKSGSGGL